MTRTKLRTSTAEKAAQIVERQACRACVKNLSETRIPGHGECSMLVGLAREIRKLGEKGTP
jgi:hypothetical protein